MDMVEISTWINACASWLKTAINSVDCLLAAAVALIVTSQKLAGLLALKKAHL